MTDDYEERRRQYVSDIRKSFHESEIREKNKKNDVSYGDQDVTETSFSFSKIRILIAVLIFGAFFYLHYTKSTILGYDAEDIIDIISDNHYYTNLQEYVMMEEGSDSILDILLEAAEPYSEKKGN